MSLLPGALVILLSAADILQAVLDALYWLLKLPVQIFHGYSWLIRSAADAVHSLFREYGYWAVFFGTLSENTLFVGLIVPGALVVILAGLSAQEGSISLPLSIVLGILGTIIGDTISYCLGRYGWSRFSTASLFREVNEKVREPLLRRGRTFVLLYHFAGYTRVVGPTAAGFLKMPYATWAPADYGGAVLWICAYTAIGFALGAAGLTLDSTDRWFRVIEWGLLVLVAIWGFYMYRTAYQAWLRHERAAAAPQADAAEP